MFTFRKYSNSVIRLTMFFVLISLAIFNVKAFYGISIYPDAATLIQTKAEGFFTQSAITKDKPVLSKLSQNWKTGDLPSFDKNSSFENVAISAESNFLLNLNKRQESFGYVSDTVTQPDGKIIVAGFFSGVNGLPRKHLVRLNADGSLDRTFNPNGFEPNSAVPALALQPDGKIIIANSGVFYNGVFSGYLMRLNSDGTRDEGFNNPINISNTVESIAVQADGKILIGGFFYSISDKSRGRIGRLNADGTIDLTFDPGTGFDQVVSTIVPQPDGKILVGGIFSQYNGIPVNGIARLNSDGSLDTTFNTGGSGTNSKVKIIVRQPDGKILVGGNFTSFNNTVTPLGIIRLNTNGTVDNVFTLPGLTGSITAIALLPNGSILAGGAFHNGSEIKYTLARFDASLGSSHISSQFNNEILSLKVSLDNKILAGGSFTRYNNEEHQRLLRLNDDGSIDNSFNANLTTSGFADLDKLTADTETLNGQFGSSVALDGDTLVVGAPSERDASDQTNGAAYIFVRNETGWTQQAKLSPSNDRGNTNFGMTVAISGNTVIVGANFDHNGSNFPQGSAYVYVRNGTDWTLQQKLVASDRLGGSQFGRSVGIDKDTVVIGASHDVIQNVVRGSAYVFNRVGSTWTQQAKLIDPAGGENEQFGISADVDGDTVIVGSLFGDTELSVSTGIACIYTKNAGVWTHQIRLRASDGVSGDRFGERVSLEGDTAVIGSPRSRAGANFNRGSAYIFVRDGASWLEKQKIVASDGSAGDQFGGAVVISGNTLVVGAPQDDTRGDNSTGSAYIFVRQGTVWQHQAKLLASDSQGTEFFGTAVAVSGNKFIIGAPGVDIGLNSNQGAAYYFIKPTSAPDLQALSDSGTSSTDNITTSHNLSLTIGGITIGATVELLRNGKIINRVVADSDTVTFNDSDIREEATFEYSTRQIVNGEGSSQSEITYVTVDNTAPSVTINQSGNQIDPTSGQSVSFTAVFNEPVVGFDISDVSFAGSTAAISGPNSVVRQTASTYLVSANNIISNGQNVRASIIAQAAEDLAGNISSASTSSDNTIVVDNVRPTVTINQAANQIDPTASQPINFSVVFSETISGFDASDISFAGSTANVSGATVSVTGSGTTFNVAIGGVRSNGAILQVNVISQAVVDVLGNSNVASTSSDNTIVVDNVAPSVTINQAAGQSDPTAASPINFTAVFTEPVTGFDASDISLTGTSADISGAQISITGSGAVYNVAVSNIISNGGNIRISVRSGGISDSLGNLNSASTSTDNIVTFDNTAPSVSIDQGIGQSDPASSQPIIFTVVFSESVSNFDASDVSLAGSSANVSAASIRITGGSRAYNVEIRNVMSSGQVIAAVVNGAARDAVGNLSSASTSTDNTITINVRSTSYDFDGDGKSDVSVFRPETGVWHLLQSQSGYAAPQFGVATDKLVPADYDGDGKTDFAVFRENPNDPGKAKFYILNSSNNQFREEQLGSSGDIPVAGDWDGDGKSDVGVYRSGTASSPQGHFYYRPSSQPTVDFIPYPWGIAGDKPVVADYDGDGKTDPAVFRSSTGEWYIQRSKDGFYAIQFGAAEDKPSVGDYDGDGKADQAVFRPSNGVWYIWNSTTGFSAAQFGISTDKAVPADYDGDGKTDLAVYREGSWFILNSTTGFASVRFGNATDKPIANSFVP